MSRCPITLDELGADEDRYSQNGLRMFSRTLRKLDVFAYSAEEQRIEAMARATKMSIQGVQPKLSVRLRVKAGRFEVVDKGGRYILKPQHHLFPHLPENEAITMRLASTVGIAVPFHGLVHSKDASLTYFIQRFDRIGRNQKLAVEDFAQLSGNTRQTKYGSSMERLVPLINRFCTFPLIERTELFRRVLFCFLTGNEDMHLKNFSVIVRDDVVKIAPAYDLLNTTIVLSHPTGRPEEMALPLKGKQRGITRNDLVKYFAVERLGLNKSVIEGIWERFLEAVSGWEKLLEQSFLPEELREHYLEVLAERRRRLQL